MNEYFQPVVRRLSTLLVAMFIVALAVLPAMSSEYPALNGVKGVKTVFDVTQGSPQTANIVFWAIKNVNDDQNVRSLLHYAFPFIVIARSGFSYLRRPGQAPPDLL